MSHRPFTLYLILLFCLSSGIDAVSAARSSFTLSNGLHVIVFERHTSPLVAIDLWVRAGSREELSAEYGAAHFLEHTVFKGTTTRRAGDADIAIENLGAVLDAATGPDYAHFYTTVSSMHLGKALTIVADVVRNAILPEVEIERERGVILDELAQHDADPSEHLIDLLYANSFPTHVYARSPGGSPAAIRERNRATLTEFYHRCYTPSRCTLVFVGDCTLEQARTEAERTFGDWKQQEAVTPITPVSAAASTAPERASAPSEPAPRHIEVRSASTYGMVGIAFVAPAAEDTQMACAGQVVAALLGDAQHAGRLATRQLTNNQATAQYTPRRDASLFILTARTQDKKQSQKSNLAALEMELMKAIQELQTNASGQDELNAARSLVLGRMQFDTETDGGMARVLGYAAIVNGDASDALRSHIRQLTRADVQQFCRRYLNPDHARIIRLLPTTDVTCVSPDLRTIK